MTEKDSHQYHGCDDNDDDDDDDDDYNTIVLLQPLINQSIQG